MTPAAYALAGFLAALYLVGEAARRCGAPALVGEIIVGLVLGPYGFDVVPQTRACTIAGELGTRATRAGGRLACAPARR